MMCNACLSSAKTLQEGTHVRNTLPITAVDTSLVSGTPRRRRLYTRSSTNPFSCKRTQMGRPRTAAQQVVFKFRSRIHIPGHTTLLGCGAMLTSSCTCTVESRSGQKRAHASRSSFGGAAVCLSRRVADCRGAPAHHGAHAHQRRSNEMLQASSGGLHVNQMSSPATTPRKRLPPEPSASTPTSFLAAKSLGPSCWVVPKRAVKPFEASAGFTPNEASTDVKAWSKFAEALPPLLSKMRWAST
mmetsp:Transcript_100887/g.263592  ORF Transcript_100887/g.263592 Transcript_100887/m.263592 type:complete len:243 (+) Transcript_100887:356-1084(+)